MFVCIYIVYARLHICMYMYSYVCTYVCICVPNTFLEGYSLYIYSM